MVMDGQMIRCGGSGGGGGVVVVVWDYLRLFPVLPSSQRVCL